MPKTGAIEFDWEQFKEIVFYTKELEHVAARALIDTERYYKLVAYEKNGEASYICIFNSVDSPTDVAEYEANWLYLANRKLEEDRSTVDQQLDTNNMLHRILQELRIMNLHLGEMTDLRIRKLDLDSE